MKNSLRHHHRTAVGYAVLFQYCGTIVYLDTRIVIINFIYRTALRCIIFYSMFVVKVYVFVATA